MVVKPKGGRGIKAPYQTKVVRIPLPLIDYLEELTDKFRSLVTNQDYDINEAAKIVSSGLEDNQINRNEAINTARIILRQKKSARTSLVKLLQVLDDDDTITEKELI